MRPVLLALGLLALVHPGVAVASGVEKLLVTDRAEYEALVFSDHVEVTIALKYTNKTKQVRYLPGCKGPPAPVMEKREGTRWIVAFAPIELLCLSYPVPEVRPGGTFEFVFPVHGFLIYAMPEWKPREVAGTYRVRWTVYKSMEWSSPDGHVLTPEAYTATVYSNEFKIVPRQRG